MDKKLTLLERILIPSILPKEANYTQIVIFRDITNKCELTQEEIKKFDVKVIEKGLQWSADANGLEFAIEFTDLESAEIVKALKKLDSEKKLSMGTLTIYEKFIKKAE